MPESLTGWFRHHPIRQKPLMSFGVAELRATLLPDLRQASANLLDHAVMFSRRSLTPEIPIGGYRTATVRIRYGRGNGIGISPEHSERIFGLFERVHDTQDYDGTGVGLAIVSLVMDTLAFSDTSA